MTSLLPHIIYIFFSAISLRFVDDFDLVTNMGIGYRNRRLEQFEKPGSFVGTWFLLSLSVHLLSRTFAGNLSEYLLSLSLSPRFLGGTSARVDIECLYSTSCKLFTANVTSEETMIIFQPLGRDMLWPSCSGCYP